MERVDTEINVLLDEVKLTVDEGVSAAKKAVDDPRVKDLRQQVIDRVDSVKKAAEDRINEIQSKSSPSTE